MKCTECEWTGEWTETNNNDDDEDTCPECGALVEDVKDSK
jgi:NAD-dependent SIR2 family protein deacetylase